MPFQSNDNQAEAITLFSGAAGPRVLIISGIHGDEFEPMIATQELINLLPCELTKGSVSILPVANRSAYTLGTRCGEDGLDLARTFPGLDGGSITEITAFQIAGIIREADYLIDLHTGGNLFDITPLAGYLLHPLSSVLEKQQMMAEAFNLPVIWGTDPNVDGRTLSLARDLNIPAIYAESGGGTGISRDTVDNYVKGCLNVLSFLGMMDYSIKNKRSSFYWLEDHRSGQGHLQIKMPAPSEGIFRPLVSRGDHIQTGAVMGSVIDPLKNQETPILAEEEGMVFMIRVSSRVNKGDTLGGILPITQRTKKIIYAE